MTKKIGRIIIIAVISILVLSNCWLLYRNSIYKNATLISCKVLEINKLDTKSNENVNLSLLSLQNQGQSVDLKSEETIMTYSITSKQFEKYQDNLQVGNFVVLVLEPEARALETYPVQLSGKLLTIKNSVDNLPVYTIFYLFVFIFS